MTTSYLVGAPIFLPGIPEDGRFPVPIHQARLIASILANNHELSHVEGQLREEHNSIVTALNEMGYHFQIALAYPDKLDSRAICDYLARGCRLIRFPSDFPASLALCPRDLAVTIPGRVLLNCRYASIDRVIDDCRITSSPVGDGGSVLLASGAAVVCDRIISFCDDLPMNRSTCKSDLEPFVSAGMKTVMFPAPVMGFLKGGSLTGQLAFFGHCDRVSCLVSDVQGGLHLVLDHDIVTVSVVDESAQSWRPMMLDETISVLRRACESRGITVHRAPRSTVPYSLNLQQFFDGRILMTGGTTEVTEMLRSITGQQIVTTNIPIQYYPTWMYAGIHCLVTEFPRSLLTK